ncbi:hypothetical protein EI171_37960 [Bradyrhizobium sp. LCT2]|nr:hypothetical protein EI171_37960 [Bradyrhizobium sp. LCT2]
MERVLDRDHDGFDPRAIGFGVALGRARTERLLSPETVLQEVMGAGPQEELKHACTFRFEAPDQKMGPGWLIKIEAFAPFGAALRHPGPPGALVLLVELEPAPLTGIRPHVTAAGRDLHPARRLATVEPLELERLLGRQANQDTPSTRIDEIAPRRRVRRTGDGVYPRSRHDPLPCIHAPACNRATPVVNHRNTRPRHRQHDAPVSSSSCVEIMMSAADFLATPEIFWAAPCLRSGPPRAQPKNQRNNRTSNSVMKYTQPAIAISATLKNAPSNAHSLIFVRGSAARAL